MKRQQILGIYIYDQVEVLDFAGPFEVFATAARLSDGAFQVCLIGETGQTVRARGGLNVTPHYAIHNHPVLDLLIVAGGMHCDELQKLNVIDWIAGQAQAVALIASVCTGVFLLAQAGVVSGDVTTHWEDCGDLRRQFPGLNVINGVRWVDQGHLVTSGGISAGIDMSLHLVGRLHSPALADQTARQMAYVWTKN